jgi:hypothetical protein
LKGGWLLAVGVLDGAAAVIKAGTADQWWDMVAAGVLVFSSVIWLARWWKHDKDKRKRLKDRVLGIVRATAAGLKVVPVPAGAQA